MQPKQSSWIIKCREILEDRSRGWHWRDYLHRAGKRRNEIYDSWGGPEWIKNHLSRKFIRDQFRTGDLVLCYQVEGRQILGFTRLASDGLKVKGVYSAFHLIPSSLAYVLEKPLSVEALRATGCSPIGFTQKLRGTILELGAKDLRGVVAAALTQNPEEETELLAWLEEAGFGDGSRPAVTRLGNAEFTAENAASSPEEVEKALASLEKALSARDDVYVKRKVRALIRRDGPLIQALKAKYKHQCQFPVCNAQIPKRDGTNYCEVAHIQAAASGGKAHRINLLVLCPNHHKMIDYGNTEVLENTKSQLRFKLNGESVTIKR